MCDPGCPRLPEPTAAVLVGAVQTVLLPVTQQVGRQAAPPAVTVVNTAVRLPQTVGLVRSVLTVSLAVAHLDQLDAPPPMGALELICVQKYSTEMSPTV